MKVIKFLSLIMISLLLLQCDSKGKSNEHSECNTPLPQAIFDKNVAPIISHSFKLNGRNAEESIRFDDNSSLTIFQSGCDKIAQEFRFQLAPQKEIDMPSLGVDRLMYLANLDDKYMSFANWAQAIDGLRMEFSTQNEVEVEAGFFVGLDKIDSTDRTTMIIRLFQK